MSSCNYFGEIANKQIHQKKMEWLQVLSCILPVIRQKGESQSGRLKKTKHVKFFRKTIISYPLIGTRALLPTLSHSIFQTNITATSSVK